MGTYRQEKGAAGTSVSTAHSLFPRFVRPLVRMSSSKSLSRELRMRLVHFLSNLKVRSVVLNGLHLMLETPALQLSIEKSSLGVTLANPVRITQ
jgi:hypothetical protein